MSTHAIDRLAVIVGVPLLLLGLVDLADLAGFLDAGVWLVVPLLVIAGGIGILSSLLGFRQEPADRPEHDARQPAP